jgi:ParB-like chromosome segregation protein Spo0J
MNVDDFPQCEYEGTISPDELTIDEPTLNEMDSDTFRRLCDHIRMDGNLRAPIIADTDGFVAAGEHRLRAAREIGFDSVPVLMYDIHDARRRLWRRRLSKTSGDRD